MLSNSVTYPVIFVTVLLTLICLSGGSWTSLTYVTQGGLLCLTVVLSNFILKLAEQYLPRKLVSDLKHKAVFITGCDTGFGNRLARRLDALGVTVYAGCLFSDSPAARDLKSCSSDNLQVMQLDVTRDEQVNDAVKFVKATIGDKQLLAVMNNAGIGCSAEAEICSNDQYERTLQVNAMGPVRVTRAFLPLLRKCRASRVVITASILGRVTAPILSAYCMSKYAAVAFAESLRYEIQKWGITVHTIEPTFFETLITDPKRSMACAQECWANVSQDVRDDYGDTYSKNIENMVIGTLKLSRPVSEMDDVVDDMIDAVIGATPEDRYMPGIYTKIHFSLAEYFPHQTFFKLFTMYLTFRSKA